MAVLLTGASGKLGSAIAQSGIFPSLLTPSRNELDITDATSVASYLHTHDVDVIIHCAALARMSACEKNPLLAIQTNVLGSCNIATAVINQEKGSAKKIRLLFLSTDGVYGSVGGNFKETSPLHPYNTYCATKIAAESAIRNVSNHCIIRTSFFDPTHIPFETAADDMFSSKMPIGDLVNAIHRLASHPFIGTINVGAARQSEYTRYHAHKPSIRKVSFDEVQKEAPIPLAQDASMDISLWHSLNLH